MKKVVSWFYSCLCLLIIIQVTGCRSHTANEQISVTTEKALKALKDSNSSSFISLLGLSDLGDMSKNEEMVAFDVKKIARYLQANYAGNTVPYEITETYNFLGQKRVKIIVDKLDPTHLLTLNLLFGPTSIAPLSKLTGYRLVTNNEDSDDFKSLEFWKQNGNAH